MKPYIGTCGGTKRLRLFAFNLLTQQSEAMDEYRDCPGCSDCDPNHKNVDWNVVNERCDDDEEILTSMAESVINPQTKQTFQQWVCSCGRVYMVNDYHRSRITMCTFCHSLVCRSCQPYETVCPNCKGKVNRNPA